MIAAFGELGRVDWITSLRRHRILHGHEPRTESLLPGWRAVLLRESRMFVFFSNRLGWLGSALVSVVLTILLLAAMRSCRG